jgi:hypothetical protein
MLETSLICQRPIKSLYKDAICQKAVAFKVNFSPPDPDCVNKINNELFEPFHTAAVVFPFRQLFAAHD